MQLRPRVGGGDVDGRVLPDRAPGAGEAPDMEAIELDQLSGGGDLQVVSPCSLSRASATDPGWPAQRQAATDP